MQITHPPSSVRRGMARIWQTDPPTRCRAPCARRADGDLARTPACRADGHHREPGNLADHRVAFNPQPVRQPIGYTDPGGNPAPNASNRLVFSMWYPVEASPPAGPPPPGTPPSAGRPAGAVAGHLLWTGKRRCGMYVDLPSGRVAPRCRASPAAVTPARAIGSGLAGRTSQSGLSPSVHQRSR